MLASPQVTALHAHAYCLTHRDSYMAVTNLASEQRDHVARMARFSLDAVKVANQTPIIAADPDEMGYVNLRVGRL